MSSDSAVLWTRASGPMEVVPQISENPEFDAPRSLPTVQASADQDFTVKTVATGLRSGTQYYYRFVGGGSVSEVGKFMTGYAPNQDVPVTMAFTGDAHWAWKPYPILNSLVEEPLDFFLFLGDLIYESLNLETGKNGTIAAESLDDYRFKYRENREPRPYSGSTMVPMRDLYGAFGQYSVFDNHETSNSRERGQPPYITGGAQAGGQFVNQTGGFRDRIQAYSEYQPVREETVMGTGDPRSDGVQRFYRAIPWGANVELFVLDDRSYRDEALSNATDPKAADCDRTMLGAPQLSWFENELRSAQARQVTWKLVVISSPIQELGKGRDGTKAWPAGYVCERNRLLKFIDDNGINNVVFLTTDNHNNMVNNLMYNSDPSNPDSPFLPARNAFEIITGPLGADTDDWAATLKVDRYGLPLREVDRRIVAVWNGDMPNSAGDTRGLRQDGFDPIGLEQDFPGLVRESVHSESTPAGDVEPVAFVSFGTFAYTVLDMDRSTLTVRVKGFPAVFDPTDLFDPMNEWQYEQREAHEIFGFQIMAQR